jgi:heat shock protein HslJ
MRVPFAAPTASAHLTGWNAQGESFQRALVVPAPRRVSASAVGETSTCVRLSSGAALATGFALLCLVGVVGCRTQRTTLRGRTQAVPATIVNTTWAWIMLLNTADHPAIRIDDAGQYTLTLQPDGSLHGAADCQTFAGVFEVSGTRLALTVSRRKPADCPSTSYARQYLSLLTDVASYMTDARGLILRLRASGGTMIFLPIA